MGERKGVNKYYPPDWRPEMGSINKYHGTHALRERANKLHLGILIIRFEMPYNIWCDGCKNHIGMGVRYNAEKTKVGMYYSTPVYQFRFKCHLCPNYIIMKTDPGNLDYIIVEGARRQERRWDPLENEQVVPEEKSTSQKLATDAMFKLEHGEKDVLKSKTAAPVIDRLQDHRERWKDDYSSNRLLRDQFRAAKKDLKAKAAVDAALLSKSSLDIQLLPQSEDDAKIASLLRLNPTQTPEERQKTVRQTIDSRPLFSSLDGDDKTARRGVIHNPFVKNSRNSPSCSALKRSSLGVNLKSKEQRESTGDEVPVVPSTSSLAASPSTKLLSLCDYTSSSSSEDSH
uniref:EOG090X0DK6 n=1 Tax=Ceriodaphnia reticulata TaxID=302197 RepID=A0A4Y7LW88_9CRUS|nr:EOG090X0DK6 [Ceriodaphnia reticulata]SVE73191.1 EOG090X0DK6 [Ceriodaphnia reticulata]